VAVELQPEPRVVVAFLETLDSVVVRTVMVPFVAHGFSLRGG
jgi:hypothetical protein